MKNHSQQYETYIHSLDWENMKQKRRKIDGNKCVCVEDLKTLARK